MPKIARARKESDFRYAPEDLAPRDIAADEAAVDAYAVRNKKTLNKSIAKAHSELARGKYYSRDQVVADLKASRQKRRAGKK